MFHLKINQVIENENGSIFYKYMHYDCDLYDRTVFKKHYQQIALDAL